VYFSFLQGVLKRSFAGNGIPEKAIWNINLI